MSRHETAPEGEAAQPKKLSGKMVFDHGRVDFSRYNNFESVSDAKLFMDMVVDYMAYVRTDPLGSGDADEALEMATAVLFVSMINNSTGWPLAKTVVAEFKTPT